MRRQISFWLSMKSMEQTMIKKLPGTPFLLKIQLRFALSQLAFDTQSALDCTPVVLSPRLDWVA